MKSRSSQTHNLYTGTPLKVALQSLSEIFKRVGAKHYSDKKISSNNIEKAILSLFAYVMWADGSLKEEEIGIFREFFMDKYSDEEIENFLNIIRYRKGYSPEQAGEILKDLPLKEKKSVVLALIEVAVADNIYSEAQKEAVKHICKIFDFNDETIKELELTYFNKKGGNKNLLSSGAGIIAALVVIAIFILTATFLKSVLFGLVLAYFFLPVQTWFHEKFFRWKPVKKILDIQYKIFEAIGRFFTKIRNKIMKTNDNEILTEEEKERLKLLRDIKISCNATVMFAFLISVLLFSGFLGIMISYVIGIGSNIKSWADRAIYSVNTNITEKKKQLPQKKKEKKVETTQAQEGTSKTEKYKKYVLSFADVWIKKIDNYGKKLEKVPGFKIFREKAIRYVKDKKIQESLTSLLLKTSGGLFSYTADIVGTTATLIFNIVLTVFFFVFFLQKMAIAKTESNLTSGPGEYIVNVLYGSRWLPNTSKQTREDAVEILNNIFFKLKTWVRGYISIILIETTIYISLFFLFRIPYPYIVGAIAGCTVLLPFIGPVVSLLITIAVYLAFTKSFSLFILISIIIIYLIMNGIVEQLFLYPALVGNALGLNTLETIIVVLLGGLFAGIAGMIFALPVAAVIKYLVPKIYKNWQKQQLDSVPA